MRQVTKGLQLTELEGAALGIVLRAGACTPYAVRRAFGSSPSRFWSGSAGAVYPLVRRLERRRLIAARADRRDRRGRRLISVTPAGRRAFEAWLLDADRAADFGFDPLRTRLFYSDLVPAARLAPFLAAAAGQIAATRAPAVPGAPHVARLHDSWRRLRRGALEEFRKSGRRN
jgi:DNA-binding PadR family transcriptional regulator